MAEIAAIPWNGYTVASTFSGCGGSCLGYRMAGFRVVWANEFVPAAQESYRANHPGSLLDTRDIREITPESILAATGLKAGELDVLDGSPPCASFSTAGKREAGWGQVRSYSDTRQRTDDLFHEYARLLKGLQPKAFVAENVSGLVKGTAKGYFLEILAALKGCGYRVTARVLDAQWLGVPQTRQRLIFVGVREDLGLDPVHPKPLPYRYSVRDALPWIESVPCLLTGKQPGRSPGDRPCPTVMVGNIGACSSSLVEVQVPDARVSDARISDARAEAPASARVIHDTGGQWARGEDVTDRPCPAITVGVGGMNSCHFQVHTPNPDHETDIGRFAIGAEWEKLQPGEQSGKYFNLVRAGLAAPSPTICASHGSLGMAGVTHPTEKRKFTIAELRRICAFPDDYILTGTYAQQWERLGRAVPPVMMRAIAAEIRDRVLACAG